MLCAICYAVEFSGLGLTSVAMDAPIVTLSVAAIIVAYISSLIK